MRTLNRPMFRYGGPIKEGVMHGIREPRRNGGSMGNQALLVGNPAFPMQNGRALHGKNLQGIFDVAKNAAKKTITTNPLKVLNPSKKLKFIKNLATTGINPLKNFYRKQISKLDMPPSFRSAGGEFKGAGTAGGGGIPLSLMDKIKYFGKANPKTTAAGVGVGLSSGVIPEAAGGIGSLAWKGAKQAADLLVYDKWFDQDKWFADREKAKAEAEIDKSKLTADQQKIKDLEKLLAQPEVPVKSDDEIREEKIQKYRDIMDIKGMNKDAAYDSLIAASQAINSSGDFKGDLKSGKLINQIIQGASKAYDKPKTTKDAIDSLILKGEIEKDINLSKGNSSTQQLAALADASGRSLKYVANARLSIPNTPGEAKSNLVKLKKTQVTSDDVASTIVQFGEDNNIPFKKHYTTEQKNKVVGEGKKFGTVIELIESEKLDPNGTDDGLYVIGLSVVEVENGVPKLRG